jgi:translation initiation factor 2B subunit (eIF-2B alpha/beta/delta family)
VAREQKILEQADARGELRNRQSEAVSRINSEANEIVREYPELDPESDSFNRELSETITEATEAYVKTQPYTASVKQFVAKLMKPYKGAVSAEVGKAQENIAKQVSQAALRPTNVRKQEKTAGEKSIAELEQELGVVQN